ncbi:MAG: hypothetical protein IT432_06670 [Phycisphaerales bacterium]|nr:hypothetical protein [Phycisphaerales bacterium]
MSARNLTQREARKARRIAQIAATGGGVLALAALLSRLPGTGDRPSGPEPIKWPDPKPPAATTNEKRELHDMNAAATRLALVSNKPKPAAHSVDPSEVSTPDQIGAVEVRYLGAVLEPTRKVALLRVGEKQRMIAQGHAVSLADGGTLEVVSVDADGCIVRDGQGERRIEKSPRTASAVTTITDGAGNAAGVPAIPPPSDGSAEGQGADDMQRRRIEAEGRMKALRERAKAGGAKQ